MFLSILALLLESALDNYVFYYLSMILYNILLAAMAVMNRECEAPLPEVGSTADRGKSDQISPVRS